MLPPVMLDRHVEAVFPGAYFNPARWRTSDGYMPFPVFGQYAAALWPLKAMERMNLAQAIGLALATEEAGHKLRAAALDEAFPEGD